jgi:hypothetical protein
MADIAPYLPAESVDDDDSDAHEDTARISRIFRKLISLVGG